MVKGRGRDAELPGIVAVGEPPPPEVPRLTAGASETLLPPHPALEPARSNERVSPLEPAGPGRQANNDTQPHSDRLNASRGVGETARAP